MTLLFRTTWFWYAPLSPPRGVANPALSSLCLSAASKKSHILVGYFTHFPAWSFCCLHPSRRQSIKQPPGVPLIGHPEMTSDLLARMEQAFPATLQFVE